MELFSLSYQEGLRQKGNYGTTLAVQNDYSVWWTQPLLRDLILSRSIRLSENVYVYVFGEEGPTLIFLCIDLLAHLDLFIFILACLSSFSYESSLPCLFAVTRWSTQAESFKPPRLYIRHCQSQPNSKHHDAPQRGSKDYIGWFYKLHLSSRSAGDLSSENRAFQTRFLDCQSMSCRGNGLSDSKFLLKSDHDKIAAHVDNVMQNWAESFFLSKERRHDSWNYSIQ